MIVRLNISVKYEKEWHDAGKKVEFPDDIGQRLTDTGQATFVGFRCPFCREIIMGDSVKQARKKWGGHKAGHRKREAKEKKKKSGA